MFFNSICSVLSRGDRFKFELNLNRQKAEKKNKKTKCTSAACSIYCLENVFLFCVRTVRMCSHLCSTMYSVYIFTHSHMVQSTRWYLPDLRALE